MNQGFFHRIWVTEDGVVGWDYNEPFATLMSAHGVTARQVPGGILGASFDVREDGDRLSYTNDEAPDLSPGLLLL